MSLELSGKLIVKYEPQEFGEKKFKTREFVIELAEEISGNTYTNYAKMQLVQAKCDIIDRFNIGDIIAHIYLFNNVGIPNRREF